MKSYSSSEVFTWFMLGMFVMLFIMSILGYVDTLGYGD
jgi:hypothetical protein